MTAGERWYDMVGPAFAAAHRALLRLDDDDVPAALRPVRAASLRRSLPRPLTRVLATHLEEEWLRTLAVAELEQGDNQAGEASRLYLSRPEGWRERIEELTAQRRERTRAHELETLRTEIERLRRVVEEMTERLRRSEARAEALEQEAATTERVEGLRRRVEEEARSRRRLAATITDLEAEVRRLRTDLSEADERISVLRSRSPRQTARPPGLGAGERTFGRGRPAETARLLDELVETLRPRREEDPVTRSVDPLRIPGGVRPDAGEAIEWIRTVERPLLLVVDGHNVAHDLDPEPGRVIRDRVVSEVARLRRLADGPLAAIVFFDTVHEAERHVNAGVSVRYVDDADAAIESVAAAADVACVVISTDREVQERAAAHGAIALWGTALSSWIQGR